MRDAITGSAPLVLLSNDDGYSAPGLLALRDALAVHADVIVCAPESNQSATSHALSLSRILRLRHVAAGVYCVDGTPADCVYVALHSGTRVLPRRPDLVVSGMNHGLNLGVDVFYSGTVAAAREAALRRIPAVAVSADSGAAARRRRPPRRLPRPRDALDVRCLERAHAAPQRQHPAGRRLVGPRHLPRRPPLYGGRRLPPRPARARVPLDRRRRRGAPRPRAGSDTEAYDAGVASVTPLSLDLWVGPGDGVAAAVAGAVDGVKG